MKLLKYFRNQLFLIISVLLLSGCQPTEWFKKESSIANNQVLAKQLFEASIYYGQGSIGEQIIIGEAISYDSTNADFWRELATAPAKRGFAAEAMANYNKAVKHNPLNWQGFRGYMHLYFYRDYKRAIADFDATDTLTIDFTDYPQGQSVDYMRGIAYYGLKNYTKAEVYFTKYIDEVTQKNGESWVDTYAFLYRGLNREKANDLNGAISDFDKALKINPNLSDCFYHKARIAMKQEQFEEAKKLIALAKSYFNQGFYHQRPYVEVPEQIYLLDIENLEQEILSI